MKKQALLVLALVLLVGMAPAYAQSSVIARFEIPFEFVVGNLTLPAGDYTATYESRNGVLQLRMDKGTPCVTVLTNAVSGNPITAGAVLRFNRYGAKHFLSQLWVSNSGRGRQIQKSDYEREVMALSLKTKGIQIAAK